MGDKEQLLAAIAAAGTQGKVDYEQAKAAQAAQQAQAIQAALAGAAATTTPEMQAKMSGIISQPYQAGSAYLDANSAAQQNWMNHAQWNTGVFQGNLERLRDALVAQAYAQAAADAAGGGGGSGRKPKEPPTWAESLVDQFGTQKQGFEAIRQEA